MEEKTCNEPIGKLADTSRLNKEERAEVMNLVSAFEAVCARVDRRPYSKDSLIVTAFAQLLWDEDANERRPTVARRTLAFPIGSPPLPTGRRLRRVAARQGMSTARPAEHVQADEGPPRLMASEMSVAAGAHAGPAGETEMTKKERWEEIWYDHVDEGWFDNYDRPKTLKAMMTLCERIPREDKERIPAGIIVFAPSPHAHGEMKMLFSPACGEDMRHPFLYLSPALESK